MIQLHRIGTTVTSALHLGRTGVSGSFVWTSQVQLRASKSAPPWPTREPVVLHLTATHPCNQKPLVWSKPLVYQYPVPLLKSALQKAVRRQRAKAAVALATQLLRQDAVALFRRWVVIVMEDAILDEMLAWVVWWMVALTKGWQLDQASVQTFLRMVYRVASASFHEYIPDKVPQCPNTLAQHRFELTDKTDVAVRTHCLALLVRVHYGGMLGDCLFLRGFAERWWARRTAWTAWQPLVAATRVKIYPEWITYPLTPLPKDARLLEGVDFHCWPQMTIKLRPYAHASDTLIEKTMWFHRSGMYTKRLIDAPSATPTPELDHVRMWRTETKAIWQRIAQHVQTLSAWYWRHHRQRATPLITDFFVRRNAKDAKESF